MSANKLQQSRFSPNKLWQYVFLAILITHGSQAYSSDLVSAKFCIWDPAGSNGPFVTFLKQTKLAAIDWGVDFQLETYSDEKVAANNFRAGECDAVFVTLILGKDFIPFASAFGAPGGIRSIEQLKVLSKTLNSPQAMKFIRQGKYELTGVFPIGEIYTFVKDRREVSISSISGKKVSVLNSDLASTRFVDVVGASPVHTTLATWSGQFNNGNMDVLFGPSLAYNTFELYKGLGTNGGIVRYNIFYAVMEMIIDHSKFPANFGSNMREHALNRFSELEANVEQATSEIPNKYWVELNDQDRKEYDEVVKRVRLELRDEEKYDSKAISLLWKIRCRLEPATSECSTPE